MNKGSIDLHKWRQFALVGLARDNFSKKFISKGQEDCIPAKCESKQVRDYSYNKLVPAVIR